MAAEAEAGAEDVVAEQTEFLRLLDREFQTGDGDRVLRTDVEVTVLRADGVAGDHHTFDDGQGVRLKDRTVHERAGVALVAVADDVLGPLGLRVGELPFTPGRETAAAATAESGFQDLVDDRLAIHRESPCKSLERALAERFLDLLGVEAAAAVKGDVDLLLIVGDVVLLDDLLPRFLVHVEQTVDDLAADQVGFHDLLDVLNADGAVGGLLGIDLDERTLRAVTEAGDAVDRHLIPELLLFDHLLELFDDLARVGRKAAGIAADDDVPFAVLALELGVHAVGTLLGIRCELLQIVNHSLGGFFDFHQAYTPAL